MTQTSVPDASSATLPPDLLTSYQYSTSVLRRSFGSSPPYTIQRLAELVLRPKAHHRFLPSYLAALNRVISVSSPVSDFPLPQLQLASNGGFLTNGDTATNGITERDGLGSDESLGGALLTPIPWLRQNTLVPAGSGHGNGNGADAASGELKSEASETIEGPNGAGRIETVSVTVNGVPSPTQSLTPHTSSSSSDDGSADREREAHERQLRAEGAVTQGELLRQEQEAGVVPVGQQAPRRTLLASGAVAVGRVAQTTTAGEEEKPEEHPHARGPDVIGMEDMGPQGRALGGNRELDMEAAVGRPLSPLPPEKEEKEEKEGEVKGEEVKEEEEEDVKEDVKDEDGDTSME